MQSCSGYVSKMIPFYEEKEGDSLLREKGDRLLFPIIHLVMFCLVKMTVTEHPNLNCIYSYDIFIIIER